MFKCRTARWDLRKCRLLFFVMGVKVIIFIWVMLISGLLTGHVNLISTFFNGYGFVMVYKNFKVWRYTNKFPGFHFLKNFTSFLGTTSRSFHNDIDGLWIKHGRDKFTTWIGFERFLTISKLKDVQVSLNFKTTHCVSFIELNMNSFYSRSWMKLQTDC